MKKAFAPVLLVLLSLFVVVACQPVMPEDQLPTTGAPTGQEGATGVITDTQTPDAQASPTTTVTTTGSLPGAEFQADLPEAIFTAVEYEFDGPESIPAGLTRIVLDNQGELPHDFLLFRLDEGRTMEDIVALLQEEPEGPPDWIEMYGGTDAEAGERTEYVVNVPPGNYGYLSFGDDEEGPPDAAQGMLGALTVTEAQTETTGIMPPTADIEVEMVDFAFNTTETWPSGEQTVYVRNTGEETHHLVIMRLQEGATFADLQPFLSEEEPEGEPPADYYGGMSDLSPGVDAYFTDEFEPGGYVFICFLPSEENDGAPHFMLGMIRQVTVE